MEFSDAKIWMSKNMSVCQVFASWVTYAKNYIYYVATHMAY